MADKKYYWLKLNKDFFDRHEIKIIEAMPNGKEYVLFYIKLMCESVSHDGDLRFSEKIPYTREMLASVTNTGMDVVDGAMDLLQDLGLVEYEDDGTYIMVKVPEMIGSAASNDNAARQQRYRDKQKTAENKDSNAERNACVTERNGTRNACVTERVTNRNESIEYRDKSKSKSIENIGYLNTLGYEEEEGASVSAIPEPGEDFFRQVIDLWNSQECTTNIKDIRPLSKRYDNTKLCIGYHTKDEYLDIIRSLDEQAWFKDRAMKNDLLKYDWFCQPDNFQKVLEGNYKDMRNEKNLEGYEFVDLSEVRI